MPDFIRARSSEQKLQRMNEIMNVTDQLFKDHSFQEITLTKIADSLGWSRSNLYKYVTTKEEIFLELYLEKQDAFFSEIESTFCDKDVLSDEEFADSWTFVLDNHHDFLRYYSILATIIETNVTVERLAEFKKTVLSEFDSITGILRKYNPNITIENANSLYWALLFHACGLNNSCQIRPIVEKAMKIAGLPTLEINFREEFRKFMLMCLSFYR